MTYPTLGTQVSYIRQTPQGEIQTGFATVMAVAIDATKRIVCHLKDPNQEHAFNTDIHCVNPSEEFISKFKELTQEVKTAQDAYNAKAQEIIDEGNKHIASLYTGLLGEPIEIA